MQRSEYETIKSMSKELYNLGGMTLKEKKKIIQRAKDKFENTRLKGLTDSRGGN